MWTWRFRWWRHARHSIRSCADAVSTGGSTAPPTNSSWPRCWSTSRLPAKGRGTEASRAREGKASFVARRRRHPGVESAKIHALESHGLDRVRTQGRAGFERTVGISILAANLHRLGRLLQQRAARRGPIARTHHPIRLAGLAVPILNIHPSRPSGRTPHAPKASRRTAFALLEPRWADDPSYIS